MVSEMSYVLTEDWVAFRELFLNLHRANPSPGLKLVLSGWKIKGRVEPNVRDHT